MVGAGDDNEAEDGRFTPPPSPTPPPPPPPPPPTSPLHATTSPPPVLPMAMDGLNLANNPRSTPPPPPPPPTSPLHATTSPPPFLPMAMDRLNLANNPRSTTPPPPPPPTSPLHATTSPPPFLPMAMDGLNLANNTRSTPPTPPPPPTSPLHATTSPPPFLTQEEDDPLDQGGDGTAWRQGQGEGEGDAGLRLQAGSILASPATPATRGCAAKGSTNRGSIRHAALADTTCADGDDGDGNQAQDCAGLCADDALDSADGQEGANLQLTLTLRIFRRWAQRRAPHVLPYLELGLVQHQSSKRDDDKSRSSDDQEDVVERYAIHPRDEEYHTTPDIIATEEDQHKDVGFATDVEEHDDSLKGEQVNVVGTFSDAPAISSAKNLGQDTDEMVEQQGANRDYHTKAATDDKSNGGHLQAIAQEHSVKDHKVAHHNTIQGMTISTDDIAVQEQKKVVEESDVQLRAARDDNLGSASDDRELMEHYAIYSRDETTLDIAAEDKEKVGSAENVDALDSLGDIAVEEHSNRVTFGDATALEDQTTGNQGAAKSGSTTEEYKDVVECFEWGVLNDLSIERIVSQLINRASTAEEPIEITITENIEVEAIGDQIESSFRGKMMVQFPWEHDRRVHFVVDKLGELKFTSHPCTDREFFKKFPVLTSERFLEGSYQLLKWHKENGLVPVPLEVSVDVKECPYTKKHNKDVTKYFLTIKCLPTGITDLQNVVVTVPVPGVDHLGISRRTRTHIYQTMGTHLELPNSIEWHIPRIGASDRRVAMHVDAFCYDGWQEPSQFYPFRVDFSCEQSFGSRVTLVVSNVDGHDVHFLQDAVGRYNFIIHHQSELVRRAAEAAEAQLAWELNWEDQDMDGDMNAEEDNFA